MWLIKLIYLTLLILTDCKKFRFDYRYDSVVDGWFKFHPIPAVWSDARLRCKLEGAVLASPNDYTLYGALRRVVTENLSETRGVFLGTHATFSKGDFFSIEGMPLIKMTVEWLPNEPDNLDNGEDCLIMLGNGSVADVACTRVFPYVCFKKRTDDMVINGCGTVDREYSLEPRTGSCYKFHRVARTWSRAFMTCAAEGSHLAIASSQQEARVLKEIFAKNPQSSILQVNNNLMRDIAHLGFHDWGERVDWTTIHGVSIVDSGYSVFPNGQPDNATTGEFCGSMFRGGELNDVWCEEVGPFVCEMVPDSLQREPEGVLDFLRIKD